MARELRWWVAGALVACGGVVLAYVPPRGGVKPLLGGPRFAYVMREPGPARRRAQQVASVWRTADNDLRLLRFRQRLEPDLARRRAAGEPGPLLLIAGRDANPQSARALARTLDTVWKELGLGLTKVSVAVVVDPWSAFSGSADAPARVARGSAYLLPDSTDRATCVALVTLRYVGARPWAGNKAWLKYALGACAFYGAFGVPGKTVRQWLGNQDYELARSPPWDRPAQEWQGGWLRDANTGQWLWPRLYNGWPVRFSTEALACLAGRAERCREAVLEGAEDSPDHSPPRFAPVEDWWSHKSRLLNGDQYLADVVREVGPERFLRFWNSALPVDTALATALKMPVGEWTERWQRRFAPRLPLGPAAPLGASALGILLAGAAVTIAAVGATRRQIR